MDRTKENQEIWRKLSKMYPGIIRIRSESNVFMKGFKAVGYIVHTYYDLGFVKIQMPGGELSLFYNEKRGTLLLKQDKVLSDVDYMCYYIYNITIFEMIEEGHYAKKDEVAIRRRYTISNILKD